MEKNLVWDFSPPKFLKRSHNVQEKDKFSFLTADMYCVLYIKKGQAAVSVGDITCTCNENDYMLFHQREGVEVLAVSKQVELKIVFLTEELCEDVNAVTLASDNLTAMLKSIDLANTRHFIAGKNSILDLLFEDLFTNGQLRSHKRSSEEIVSAIALVIARQLIHSGCLQLASHRHPLHVNLPTQDLVEWIFQRVQDSKTQQKLVNI